MSKLPDLQRGQPIDFSFLDKISKAVNALYDALSSSKSNLKLTNVGTNTSIQSSSLLFSAGIVKVNSTKISPKGTLPFNFPFNANFLNIPVVTATMNTTGDAGAKDSYAVITDVTNKSVTGYVLFPNSGAVSAEVNIIAIGN
jgi:hypothetical protein